MITRLEAHGYRCFPSLSVDLDRYHVLAGANGAGKTTLLDIPALIGDMLRRQEALEHLKRHHKVRVVNADFGKLAAVMSVRQCQDPAFNQLRNHLRAWFPEQP